MKFVTILFIYIFGFYSLSADEIFQIKSKWTGKCLDAKYQDKGRNGNRIILWDCNENKNQQWNLMTLTN